MVQIENVEEWRGSDVVDVDGEKVGRLDEVYSEVGSDEPAIGAVRIGRLGRHRHLLPLASVSLGQGHVRVPVSKDLVASSPEVESEGHLSRAEEIAFLRHFDLPDPAPDADGDALRYESSSVRAERRAHAAAQVERAEELEAEAAERGEVAAEAEGRAQQAHEEARAARDDQDRLLTEARDQRASAAASELYRPTSEPPS